MPDFPFPAPHFQLPPRYSLRIGSRLLDLSRPRVMGILNLNTDSFYEGSRVSEMEKLVQRVSEMLEEGADILDLGAVSTRSGGAWIPEEEEARRLIPFLSQLIEEFPKAVFSVDTFRSGIAAQALDAGAHIINDISGGTIDPELPKVVARYPVPYILMHLRGDFRDMHNPQTYEDLPGEMISELSAHLAKAREAGVRDVVLDPGFGFSKNMEQSLALFRNIHRFYQLDCPILIGVSRKSMIYKTLGTTATEALNGTTALHMAALMQGAHILRVHDVKEAREVVQLFEKLCSPEL